MLPAKKEEKYEIQEYNLRHVYDYEANVVLQGEQIGVVYGLVVMQLF